MMCSVCKLVELKGNKKLYCSLVCQRKGGKIKHHEKILAGKKKYRETHQKEIAEYNRLYKKRIQYINDNLSKKMREESNCLRCDGRSNLEVHHIKRQDLGGGADDPNNLVVLCKKCHALWHSMFPISYWQYGD